MAESEDYHLIQSKCKAISALLPYAVRQEQGGQPEMLDAFLCAARASKMMKFGWAHTRQYSSTLISNASPRAITLVSPHIHWGHLIDRGDLVQHWAVAVSAVPYTEEVAQSVVDTSPQIAYQYELLPYIPVDIWPWLTKQPSLPPHCLGSINGFDPVICRAVWGLRDTEITKCYLLLLLSEHDHLSSDEFDAAYSSIHEDFGGVGKG